ncbi:MAG: FecR domain-containing protein [Dyella sp.]|nr:FecR domain-containing protein [Dyella sp.]MBV8271577.1 FecR domain-containing protein [Cupriavidus sp.]
MARQSDRPQRPAAPPDPLAPFKDALREQFPSKDALLKEARAVRQRRQQRATAAGLVAIVAAMAALWVADPTWQTTRIATRIGEQATWTLRDGSRIQLNTGSVASVENHVRSQRVALESGEALFTVSHGWRKFYVQAGDTTILDIGTVFNVRRQNAPQDASVHVAVLAGEVEVTTSSRPQPMRLRVGRGVEVNAHGAMIEREADAGTAVWAEGKLALDGAPLRQLLTDLQRYRTAPIRLRDDSVGGLRLSGEFRINRIEALIDALPSMLPVTVTRLDDGTVNVDRR